MAESKLIPVANFVDHLDMAKPHHRAWLLFVLERLQQLDPTALQRDSESYAIWQGAVPGKAVAFALPIVQEFEGCKLRAYPDPGTGGEPWTIGWGSTSYSDGRSVRQGDTITQAEADDLLSQRLERDCKVLAGRIPRWGELNAHQQAALLSFSYNVGVNWYDSEGFATITARIRGWDLAGVPAAMLLYVNPGTPVEEGLRRRRKAEGTLFTSGDTKKKQDTTVKGEKLLKVPYYAQTDSRTNEAQRMCFSSSCAMLLQYLMPGTLTGINGDDQYLRMVKRFGDTTESSAQLRALASYGISAQFVQRADFGTIEKSINNGMPVPVGWIHRGPIAAPTGGGHWSIIVGYTSTHVIVNDPYGEADLINGTTLPKSGQEVLYSRKNFGRRWMADGESTGWAILAQHPKPLR